MLKTYSRPMVTRIELKPVEATLIPCKSTTYQEDSAVCNPDGTLGCMNPTGGCIDILGS